MHEEFQILVNELHHIEDCIRKQLSDANFKTNKLSSHFKRDSELVHFSKLQYHPQNLKPYYE